MAHHLLPLTAALCLTGSVVNLIMLKRYDCKTTLVV
eukprot:CAMPEP_0202889732 /NCGR_PEP_ID=MMETSP1392-20130828/323_1 /ASSEMBLY_ACC=CAM_ASM_000868 /TAXON_ID=225041 /ORGANISM="Chlamydomonas chlamydogama, Strain SAG 11-48b" /LENGTH=35 /DNA_ID= /DNA_START= /DNA_END= /DNA_ORIENTATION=